MYALQASKQHGVGPLAFQHKASSRQSMNPSPVSPALNVGQGAPAMFAAAGPMLGDYRDRLPGESSNDYWRRMEEHEREHGIDPTEGARPWPSPEPVAGQCHGSSVGPMGTLRKGNGSVTGGVPFVAHPLRARDAKGVSQDGRTGRPYNIVTNERQHGPMAMAGMDEAAETLDASYYKGPGNVWGKERQMVAPQSVPRRLTPIECERLQGFPDDHTAWGVDEDGERVDMADSPRYRMMGNAVTVNVAHWIGRRIKIAQQDTDNG
jgi:site-specific DNA-cytosine methylase